MNLPAAATWNWWKPLSDGYAYAHRLFQTPMPVYVAGASAPNSLDLPVYLAQRGADDPVVEVELVFTGRTVRTMGGVWLGPCKPPEGDKE